MARIVIRIPLAALWDGPAPLPHARGRPLFEDDAADALRAGARLAVAELGEALRWVPAGQAHAFWAHEAAPRFLVPGTPPPAGGYAYAASLWTAEDARPVLLLEVRE